MITFNNVWKIDLFSKFGSPIVWESRNRKKYKLAPATRLTLSLKKEEEEEKKGKNTYNCKWKRWS